MLAGRTQRGRGSGHPARFFLVGIGPGGLEPPFPDPKSGVLPLDEGPAILGLQLRHITPLRQRLEEGLAGVANALGWSTVAIYLLLALGYGYFLRAGPSGEQR